MSQQPKMSLRGAVSYVRWRLRGRPVTPAEPTAVTLEGWLDVFGASAPEVPDRADPLLLILVGGGSTDERFFDSVSSVLNQTDRGWSLSIVARPADEGRLRAVVLERGLTDDRISFHAGTSADQSVADRIEDISDSAPGTHVMLIDGDVVFVPNAVAWFRSTAEDVDLIYADEISSHAGGRRPVFKPAWSPTLVASDDYLGSVIVVRCELMRSVGGYGSGHRDLSLRLAAGEPVVAHLPNLLFEVDRIEQRSAVRWTGDAGALVQVVIPTRDRVELLQRAVGSVLEATGVPNLLVVIVDNGSSDPATLDYLAEITTIDRRVVVVRDDEPFNFSRVCNRGAAFSDGGDVLVFLNNDVSTGDRLWLRQLVGWFDAAHVGAVGGRLDFPDGRIQHMGVVVGRDQFLGDELPVGYVPLAAHVGHGLAPEQVADSLFASQRDVSALTAACLAVRGEEFRSIGGFDEELAIDFQDVDLCLRLVTHRGCALVYDPTVVLDHEESASRGSVGASAPETLQLMAERWADVLINGDPFYSPHLALDLTMRPIDGLDASTLASRLAPRISTEHFHGR